MVMIESDNNTSQSNVYLCDTSFTWTYMVRVELNKSSSRATLRLFLLYTDDLLWDSCSKEQNHILLKKILTIALTKNIKLEYKDFMGSHNGYFIKRRHSQSDSLLKIIQEIEQTEIDFDEYSHVKIFWDFLNN